MTKSATKSADAFKTISEAATQLDLPQHVLRHWEDTFGTIRPMRRAGGRRYYRTYDIELLAGVKSLLHDQRFTTKGVQKIFKDHGPQYVADIGKRALAGEDVDITVPDLDGEDATENNLEYNASMAHPGNVSGLAIKQAPAGLKGELEALLERLQKVQGHLDDALVATAKMTSEE